MVANSEIIDCLQLINSENIGPVKFFKLIEKFGTAAKALEWLNENKRKDLFSRNLAERELERAEKSGVRILTAFDEDYPRNLKAAEDKPPLLYVKGNVQCLNAPLSISIVGARNASINARKLASKIAYDLTNNQVMVVSGMARGIDAAAHKGALFALGQKGQTVAVLGTGVDVVYPQENKGLYEQISEQGAVVSEFLFGTQPQAVNFPRRNRVVSALSLGTLVVEAKVNSGSLITARYALEQGREVFAVPGFPDDARSSGSNKLIKEGAALVENAQDILDYLCVNNQLQVQEQLQLNFLEERNEKNQKIDDRQQGDISLDGEGKIIDYLNYEGIYVDDIIRASGLDASTIAMKLLELELDGKLVRMSGNKVALMK